MSLREDLIAAKALIDTPEKWGKGFARYLFEPFCAFGACREVEAQLGGDMLAMRYSLTSALPSAFAPSLGAVFFEAVPAFNDDMSTTHADIMALFDRAIAATPSPSETLGRAS